jgi:transposase InsO family protein
MCEVLEVSKSGYYAWCYRSPSLRTLENEQLSQQIQQIHQTSRKTYGAPRIHAALKEQGFHVGRHRVARLMWQQGICVRPFLECPKGYNVDSNRQRILIIPSRLPKTSWDGILRQQSRIKHG